MADLRPLWDDFRLVYAERADFRFERSDFGSGRADFSPESADFRL